MVSTTPKAAQTTPEPASRGTLPPTEQATVDLFKKVRPSVAYITTLTQRRNLWVANYYSARNPLRLSSLVILGVVARMFRCATRSSCWCT